MHVTASLSLVSLISISWNVPLSHWCMLCPDTAGFTFDPIRCRFDELSLHGVVNMTDPACVASFISAWKFAGGALSAVMAGKEWLYLFMEDGVGGAQLPGGGEPQMDGVVWSRLPEDLLHLVLLRLPILSQRRFMCVCWRWRCMLSDPSFAKQCDATAAAPACLCCFGMEAAVAAAGQGALRLPKSCLRPRRIDPSSLPGSGSFPLDLWASDKGLLCFSKRKQGYGETYLYICNPVTRMWKPLPVLRFEEFEVVHRAFMQVPDLRSMEYDVVLLAKTLAGSCRVFVYSSGAAVRGWKRMEWDILAPSPNREPVLCKGVIHAWRSSPALEKIEDSSFCITSGSEVDMPHPPKAPFRKLVEVDGSLFLASFLEPFAGISIWQLDEDKGAWLQISACPAREYMTLTASRTPPVVARLKVGAVAGYICICTEKALSRPALAYDTRGNTWCAWDFGVADPRSRKKVFPFHPISMHLHN